MIGDQPSIKDMIAVIIPAYPSLYLPNRKQPQSASSSRHNFPLNSSSAYFSATCWHIWKAWLLGEGVLIGATTLYIEQCD